MYMDYYWRNYIDISSCMLFEATGDSEIDSHINPTIANHDMGMITSSSNDPEDVQMMGLDEDDAFSCSCENECCGDFHHPTNQDYVFVDDGDEERDDQDNDDEQGKLVDNIWDRHFHEYHEDEDEDEDAVDQVRRVNNVLKSIDRDQPGPGVGGGGIEVVMNTYTMQAKAGRGNKLKVCGKPESINQRDDDRRFWETCLSS